MRRLVVLWFGLCAWESDCSRTSLGYPPLDDPFFRSYRGAEGGLYPGRSNRRPAVHETLGLREAQRVTPLDPNGSPVFIRLPFTRNFDNRRTVLLSAGGLSATQEFALFADLARRDDERNGWLTIVNGAFADWPAGRIARDPETYWSLVSSRLRDAGVTAAQVQGTGRGLAGSVPDQRASAGRSCGGKRGGGGPALRGVGEQFGDAAGGRNKLRGAVPHRCPKETRPGGQTPGR